MVNTMTTWVVLVRTRGRGGCSSSRNANIDLMAEFLQDQVQFRDQRMLKALEREGAGFLRLPKACKEKERRSQSTQSRRCSTALDPRMPK
jgi:hypothetical protein